MQVNVVAAEHRVAVAEVSRCGRRWVDRPDGAISMIIIRFSCLWSFPFTAFQSSSLVLLFDVLLLVLRHRLHLRAERLAEDAQLNVLQLGAGEGGQPGVHREDAPGGRLIGQRLQTALQLAARRQVLPAALLAGRLVGQRLGDGQQGNAPGNARLLNRHADVGHRRSVAPQRQMEQHGAVLLHLGGRVKANAVQRAVRLHYGGMGDGGVEEATQRGRRDGRRVGRLQGQVTVLVELARVVSSNAVRVAVADVQEVLIARLLGEDGPLRVVGVLRQFDLTLAGLVADGEVERSYQRAAVEGVDELRAAVGERPAEGRRLEAVGNVHPGEVERRLVAEQLLEDLGGGLGGRHGDACLLRAQQVGAVVQPAETGADVALDIGGGSAQQRRPEGGVVGEQSRLVLQHTAEPLLHLVVVLVEVDDLPHQPLHPRQLSLEHLD
ncbi:hypothetical protein TYRP_001685 [Tyrophagus putrescentiae]|nr:hypothetical protein TYRP_001685 [Tyrophagus putrescentiae]